MKFVSVLVSVIAVFTADSDSRIFPDNSDTDPDIADNVTPPSGGYSPGEIVEHFPEELVDSNDGEKSENINKITQTYIGYFTDEAQNFPIDSVDSQVDQQFIKEKNGFNTPELRGKKQDKVIKQLVKDLAEIKYNLTHTHSDLKEDLQSIKDYQSNFTSVGSGIKLQLQSLKESQNNFTDIGTDLHSAIGNINSSNSELKKEIYSIKQILNNKSSLIISKLDSILAKQGCSARFTDVNDQCLNFSSQSVTWTKADAECKRLKSRLVVPKDLDKLKYYFTVNKLSLSQYWVGASDQASPGTYKWFNGTAVDSKYWFGSYHTGKGRNHGQSCVKLQAGNKLIAAYDTNCNTASSYKYICEEQ